MKVIIRTLVAIVAVMCVVSCASEKVAVKGDTRDKAGVAKESSSQAIKQISYDADSKTLVLKLNRGTYSYADVPAEVHDALLKSESQGAYFSAEIKDKYKATKIKK